MNNPTAEQLTARQALDAFHTAHACSNALSGVDVKGSCPAVCTAHGQSIPGITIFTSKPEDTLAIEAYFNTHHPELGLPIQIGSI